MERRGFFGWLLGALGLSAAEVSAVKVIDANPSTAVLVLRLGEGYDDPNDDQITRIQAKFAKLDTGFKLFVIPAGCEMFAVPTGGVVHKEHLGEYGYEIMAKNEEDLLGRLRMVQDDNLLDGRFIAERKQVKVVDESVIPLKDGYISIPIVELPNS